MNTLDITKLYNHLVKKHFIEDISENNGTRRTIYFNFKRASKMEKHYNKDIYEMTFEELESVFYSAKFTSENAVRAFISNITTYIEWASKNGYRASNLPKLPSESISSIAHKYVSKTLSVYYTQEDLMEYYDKIINLSDILILQCIFEGIRGQASSEIFNLKIEDVYEKNNKYFANLYDTEKGTERTGHEISEYLYNLMFKVNELEFTNDVKGRQLELIPSPYILKKTAKGNKNNSYGEKLTTTYLTNRRNYFMEVFETKKFRYKDIEKSGVMHYLHQLIENKDTPVAEAEEYKLISDRFNVGKYVHSFYEDEVVNYTMIKGLIDVDFYKENYGEIQLT